MLIKRWIETIRMHYALTGINFPLSISHISIFQISRYTYVTWCCLSKYIYKSRYNTSTFQFSAIKIWVIKLVNYTTQEVLLVSLVCDRFVKVSGNVQLRQRGCLSGVRVCYLLLLPPATYVPCWVTYIMCQ